VETINGLKYYRTGRENTLGNTSSSLLRWIKRVPMFYSFCKRLETICEEEKPDIIHSLYFFSGLAANRVGRRLNIPRVYEPRSLAGSADAVINAKDYDSLKYKIPWTLDKWAMLGATAIAPLSRVLKNELARRGIPPERMDVVDNCVDTERFKPLARSEKIEEMYDLKDCTVVGYIGSIRKIEGLSLVVESSPEIIDHFPNVRFMIVGAGDDLENLKAMVDRKGVTEYFVFTGLVPNEKILEYYSVIDIFALPRVDAIVNQTVSPLKPLEVMSTEKALLCSDVGGFSDIIENKKTGMLFKTEDNKDFLCKAMELIVDEKMRATMGKKARQWVMENRRLQDMFEKQYKPIYMKALGNV
jgi:glycogen(starch) synthase